LEAPFDAGFIAKLSPEGEWLWARQVGQEPSAMVTSVAVDAQGAVFVTGWFWGTATFGGQTLEALDADDAFIARLSADGAWEWARQIEGNGARGTALVVDPDGAPVVMGGFWGEAILGDETLDRKSTRLNSSHVKISYAVFCLKKKRAPRARRPGG